jgi:hypothetical protein
MQTHQAHGEKFMPGTLSVMPGLDRIAPLPGEALFLAAGRIFDGQNIINGQNGGGRPPVACDA